MALQCAPDAQVQFVEADQLIDTVVESGIEELPAVSLPEMGADRQGWNLPQRRVRSNPGNQFEPGHSRHADIGNDEIETEITLQSVDECLTVRKAVDEVSITEP
jgi:hypothetical protein